MQKSPTLPKLPYDKFYDEVFEHLEYYGTPELVSGFEPADVARSFAGAIMAGYVRGISPRFTAIIVWSLTIRKVMAGGSDLGSTPTIN